MFKPDIRMAVELCDSHWMYLSKAWIRRTSKKWVINLDRMIRTWKYAEKCHKCRWSTTFGKRRLYKNRRTNK